MKTDSASAPSLAHYLLGLVCCIAAPAAWWFALYPGLTFEPVEKVRAWLSLDAPVYSALLGLFGFVLFHYGYDLMRKAHFENLTVKTRGVYQRVLIVGVSCFVAVSACALGYELHKKRQAVQLAHDYMQRIEQQQRAWASVGW